MQALWQDLRYGFRMLAAHPGFTAVAALTLALGIGANTAIFTVVDAVLLRGLPYNDPNRLVMVWENDRLRGTRLERASAPDFMDFRAQAQVFEGLSGWQSPDLTITGEGEPERLVAARVSANYFSLLGVRPLAGRGFLPEEEQVGRDKAVVLSQGLWQRRFGADRSVLGKSITLDGESFTVVGVMPAEARIPLNPEELWIPLAFQGSDLFRGVHRLRVFGRLKPGVTLLQAQTEMSGIMRRLEQTYPDDNLGRGAVVVALHEQLVGDSRPALLILYGAVGLVLLIACLNVANLLVARASARGKEIAIRAALGAGRWRVIRQLVTENLALAALGACGGLLLAAWGVDLIRVAGPKDLPRLEQAGMDPAVLSFALAISLLTWVVFSLAPAINLSAPSLHEALKEGGRGGAGRQPLRRFLVISETALAMVLLVGAGLLIRSLSRLAQVDPGYDPRNVLTMSLQLPPARYPMPKVWPILKWPQAANFQERLLEKVKARPGVESAALAYSTPASASWTTRMTIVGRPEPPPGEQDEMHFRPVSEEYFRTARLPLEKGRDFTPQDDGRHPLVGIINQSFARRYFAGQDPIGQRIKIYDVARQIVGVVADEKFLGLQMETPPAVYLPFRQNLLNMMSLIVRSSGDPMRLAPGIQRDIWSLDGNLAVFDVTTLEQALATSLAQRRFTMILLGGFAGVALLLAAVGIYGVVSYSVSRRTREIGIRMALGAQKQEMVRLVVGQALRLSLLGVLAGSAGAAGLTGFLKSQLYGVSAIDPATFVAVAVLLTLVALAAAWLPARRATRVDPMVALRYE
jgi:putative ABC transport system permease protein